MSQVHGVSDQKAASAPSNNDDALFQMLAKLAGGGTNPTQTDQSGY
jgi:hypothetical protein